MAEVTYPEITPELRAELKLAVDARRRLIAAEEPAMNCLLCGKPLPVDSSQPRRKFCCELHTRQYLHRYRTSAA